MLRENKALRDSIVEDVRKVRDEHAAQFNYDLDAIFADMKRIETESKEPRVSFGPRRIPKTSPSAAVEPTAVAK